MGYKNIWIILEYIDMDNYETFKESWFERYKNIEVFKFKNV